MVGIEIAIKAYHMSSRHEYFLLVTKFSFLNNHQGRPAGLQRERQPVYNRAFFGFPDGPHA